MANLRTGDYKGFNYATASANDAGSGLMLWSGSMVLNKVGAYTSYSGIGLELIQNSDSYFRFATSTSTQPGELDIRAQQFFVGTETSQFVSGSGNNIEISSSNFHLKPDGGLIVGGDATINANLSVNSIFTPANTNASNARAYIDQNGTAKFAGDGAGAYKAVFSSSGAATIAGFTINTAEIKSDNDNLRLKANGQITASAGEIAGFTIDAEEIKSSNNTLRLKSNGQISASAGKIAGWDIVSTTLRAQSSTDSSQGLLLAGGTGPSIRLGEIDGAFPSVQMFYTDGNDYGYRITDSSGVNRVYLGKASGNEKYEISGWSLGANELTGGKMIIRKDGTIESSGFASDVPGSGFRLTAEDGGFLEVENARIRGTLSTAVFEKETVNAVGGQLYVANSSTLTGSGQLGGDVADAGIHRNTDTTMSVANVSGFATGEILTLKKFTNTGFSTEYVYVNSSSRADSSSETDLSGRLYVQRGYTNIVNTDTQGFITDGHITGSNDFITSTSQSYSGSQTIVSTGKWDEENGTGTGYIRLNANPNDQFTPYIDIVERTGSGIYDLDLKARLGDLSGLSSDRLHGTPPSGQYGLYSKNVFLEGGIIANTGSIAGIKMQNGKLFTGVGTHGISTTQFYADDAGKFSLGNNFIWDPGASELTIRGAIRQTAGGATLADFVNRGAWAPSTAYAINDLVQYTLGSITSTYRCQTAHTSTANTNTSTGRPNTANSTAWEAFALGSEGQDGDDGADGTNGQDAFTIDASPTDVTIPVDTEGTDNYTGAGLGIRVWIGNETASYQGGTFNQGYKEFRVASIVTAGISVGTPSIGTGLYQSGDPSNMTSDNANINYVLTINLGQTTTTAYITQNLKRVFDGATGPTVKLDSNTYAIGYAADGTTPSPSAAQTLTATGFNLPAGTNNYQFYEDGAAITNANTTSPTYDFTPPDSFSDLPINYSVKVREGGSQGPVIAEDTITIFGVKPGTSGTDGDPGAGIVYRGEWASGVSYTGTTTRKDVIKGSDGQYYIAKSTHTSATSTKPIAGSSYATYWEGFGASFTSVATDILFSSEVYADQTINIGSDGGSQIISLNADSGDSNANPYIGINATSYDSAGIFMGYDSEIPKLSLKPSSGNNYMKWDGTDLLIAGTIKLDDGTNRLTLDSDGVKIQKSADTYALVDTDGLTIHESGTNVANFGSSVRVGPDATDKSALRIDSSGNLTIGTSNNSSISLDTVGTITATDIVLGGVASARAIAQQVVEIRSHNRNLSQNSNYTSNPTSFLNNANQAFQENSHLYLKHGTQYGIDYTDIILDGSEGGEKITHIICSFGAATDSDGTAIGDWTVDVDGVLRKIGAIRRIVPMNLPGDANANITIEIGCLKTGIARDITFEAYTVNGSQNFFGHSAYAPNAFLNNQGWTNYGNLFSVTDGDDDQTGGSYSEPLPFTTFGFAQGGIYTFKVYGNYKLKYMSGTTNPFDPAIVDLTVSANLHVGSGFHNEITCTGDIVAFSTSDKNLKDNITPILDSVKKIQSLSGNTFTWNTKANSSKSGSNDIGVIAQEVQDTLPDAVREVDGILSVRYEKIIPLLIEGIKEQQTQINDLKRLIEESNGFTKI